MASRTLLTARYGQRSTRLAIGASPQSPSLVGLATTIGGRVATSDRCSQRLLKDAPWFCFNGDFGKRHWQVPLINGQRLRAALSPAVLHLTPTGRGGIGVPAKGSPTVRRRELGVILRALRTQKGLTAEQVAERLLVSPSKISRLEKGQRGASARDIRDLCDLFEVDDEQRQRLTDLASEGKQRAWWLGRDLTYSTYVGLEAEADAISDYGLGIVPGLLQTADYARAVVQAMVPKWVPEIVEQRVEARLARQQQLLFSDHPPRFEAVIDESVLHRIVGSPVIMKAQLERLLELSELPHVTLSVIPYGAGAMPAGINKFIILAFVVPTIPDLVFVEHLTADLYLEEPGDVEAYNATFRALEQLALTPDATYELIASMAEGYGVQSRQLTEG